MLCEFSDYCVLCGVDIIVCCVNVATIVCYVCVTIILCCASVILREGDKKSQSGVGSLKFAAEGRKTLTPPEN